MSHTVSVDIEIRNRDAFLAAVSACGGEVIGEGEHRLYSTYETGFAVQLPGWSYPIVLTEKGLRYDNYGGYWGDQEQLDTLIARYAVETARAKATELGWYSEAQPDGSLLIFHPDGGTLTVTGSGVSVACVEGQSCVDISAPIEEALGRPVERSLADDYYIERARVTATEGDSVPAPEGGQTTEPPTE